MRMDRVGQPHEVQVAGCGPGVLFLLAALGWLWFEVWLVARLGQAIGALPTALLLVGTCGLGVALLRSGGLALARRAMRWGQDVAYRGESQALPLGPALPRLLAGVLLLVPGFGTDLVGLLCLLPPFHGLLGRAIQRYVERTQRASAAALRERVDAARAAADGIPPGGVIIEGVVVTRTVARDGPAAGEEASASRVLEAPRVDPAAPPEVSDESPGKESA